MKKVLSVILCIAILSTMAVFFAGAEDYYRSIYPNIQGSGLIVELAQFGFSDLLHYAETVAVVTPLDELTADNTFGISGKRYDNIHSLRRVKALQYFKNEQGYGDSFEMTEFCGLLEDGTLVMTEDCWPMQRGVVYLVFLRGRQHPAPVSACNGKFDLTHLELNCSQHAQVLLTALLELDCENYYRRIVLNDFRFDLVTLPGFRAGEASSWSAGQPDGPVLTLGTGITDCVYSYHCGRGFSAVFTLSIEGPLSKNRTSSGSISAKNSAATRTP